jgi:tripeptide aminopeptidase
MRSPIALLTLALSIPLAASAQEAPVRRILDSPEFKTATAFIEKDQSRFVRELIQLTEIPAPPFNEQRRAQVYLDMLREAGLSDVEMDPEGNVMGVRKGSGGGMVAVVAHLDTVFPEGTDVKVKREGTKLNAPGVGDNTRGAALMLAVIRAMNAAKFQTTSDILFVGNVGEEGEGDLRGVKFLMQKGKYKDRITQFIAIDGGEQGSITRGGVGSRRYRVTFKGPGGPQLWRFRPRQSGLRDGQRHRKVLPHPGAEGTQDHVQRRGRQRRDLGELHPIRNGNGGRHAVGGLQ